MVGHDTNSRTGTSALHSCSYKAEIRACEAAEIGKNGGKIGVVHAEPGGKGRKVLIAGGGGNPAAGADVIGTTNGQCGEGAVGLLALNGAAHNHMVAAPAVVA